MPQSEKKPAEEFFYHDGRDKQDEQLHIAILDKGDAEGAAAVGRKVAKRLGLTSKQIDRLMGHGKR